MPQEESFPSLDQVLIDHLHGFPRQALLAEAVDSVRENLWKQLVQGNRVSIIQYMAIWCEYLREKELAYCDGLYFYGVTKDIFANFSKEDMMNLSLNGLHNGFEQHLSIMNQWEQACRDENTQNNGDDAITEKEDESEEEDPASRSLVPTFPFETRRTSGSRPQRDTLPSTRADEVTESPPVKRKRGRPRKYPLPGKSEASASPDSSAAPKRRRGRPKKRETPSEQGRKQFRPSKKRRTSSTGRSTATAVVTPPRRTRASTSSHQQDSSQRSRPRTRREGKPRQRFDPCAGHGRHWSEPKQPIRKVPQHVLMSPPKKKKTDRMLFNIENRGTKPGDYKPKSLWKYVDPKDNHTYILQIANKKGVSKDGKIDVILRGYGKKSRKAIASRLEVPTDEDFETFEANYRAVSRG